MVSVILPIFGEFRVPMLRVCLESLKLQEGVRLEITVAGPDDRSDVENLCEELDCNWVGVPPEQGRADGAFVPGAYRNAAAARATGDYLFNADIDVLYLSKTFFIDLVNFAVVNNVEALYWPPMRRMPVYTVPLFLDMASSGSLAVLLGELDLDRPFLASIPGIPPPETVVFRNNTRTGWIAREAPTFSSISDDGTSIGPDERILVYLADDLDLYRSSPDNRGKEPFFCTQDIHCGSTLVATDYFWLAGGFCLDFTGWGCHDADFQAKLRRICSSREIPRQKQFCVVHLDHQRNYFDCERWRANRRLLEERRERVDGAIAEDRKNLAQFKEDE
jgi:hypothetical protein